MTSSEQHKIFHGIEPREIIDLQGCWFPGELVFIGQGVDCGYDVNNPESKKSGLYIHDFGPHVDVFRRAKPHETADLKYKNFPRELTVLGEFLGCSYKTERAKQEIKGSRTKYLCVTPSRKVLAVINKNKGVEFVMFGGNMYVEDWIRG